MIFPHSRRVLNNALFDPPSSAQLKTVSEKIATYYSWEHSAEVLHREILRIEGREQKLLVYGGEKSYEG